MSTIKISELPEINHFSTNTGATLFVGVDVATGTTGKANLTTLGEGLYAYQALKVGENQVLFSNTIGQFSGNSNSYLQINHQNFNANGSTDYVASTSDSDNSNKYIDMGIDGPTYNDPVNYPFFKPYDGYLYVYGPSSTSSSGNLIVGTASSNSTITFITGLSSYKNVVAKMTSTGLVLNTQSYITFADGSVQTVAYNAGTDVTQNTRLTIIEATDASQNARMTIIEGVDVTQNTSMAVLDGKMQSAYNKANNALANTTGTFAGDLTITGNVISNSGTIGNLTISNNAIYSTGTLIDFNNSTFNPNTAFVQITGSNNAVTIAPSNTNYMLQVTGKANSVTRVVIDSFGQNSYPVVVGRMGRGSTDLPTATQNNDVMMRIVGNGYTGTQFPSSSPTKIDFVASENFSDANRGTQIQFWNTPIGSNTIQKIATFNADAVSFTGTVGPQKGFIYTPNIYPSAQTAITIDFANNSLVRAQTATGLVVTLSNFVTGKSVEAWITNTAGTTQTFTHGVSAINSSVNATTYGIPSTSSIFVKYWCMDGTLTNTFCSIVHA